MTRREDGISLGPDLDADRQAIEHLREGRNRHRTTLPTEVDQETSEFAERKLKGAIEIAADALGDLADMVASSEDPKAYAAVARLTEAIATASDKLVRLRDGYGDKRHVAAPPVQVGEDDAVVLFKGSTAELQALLDKSKKG